MNDPCDRNTAAESQPWRSVRVGAFPCQSRRFPFYGVRFRGPRKSRVRGPAFLVR